MDHRRQQSPTSFEALGLAALASFQLPTSWRGMPFEGLHAPQVSRAWTGTLAGIPVLSLGAFDAAPDAPGQPGHWYWGSSHGPGFRSGSTGGAGAGGAGAGAALAAARMNQVVQEKIAAELLHFHCVATKLPMSVPGLDLEPQGTRIAGEQDLDVEYEEINRRYRISAEHREMAYNILCPPMLEILAAVPPMGIRFVGDDLMVWTLGEPDPAATERHAHLLRALVDAIPGFVWQRLSTEAAMRRDGRSI